LDFSTPAWITVYYSDHSYWGSYMSLTLQGLMVTSVTKGGTQKLPKKIRIVES
jgi:hypothetical protein